MKKLFISSALTLAGTIFVGSAYLARNQVKVPFFSADSQPNPEIITEGQKELTQPSIAEKSGKEKFKLNTDVIYKFSNFGLYAVTGILLVMAGVKGFRVAERIHNEIPANRETAGILIILLTALSLNLIRSAAIEPKIAQLPSETPEAILENQVEMLE